MQLSYLWAAPEINPINRKARSIPFLNPINVYGRVFFFSWFGFMVAFWAWYTFPPLVSRHFLFVHICITSNSPNALSNCSAYLVSTTVVPHNQEEPELVPSRGCQL